MLPPPDPSDPGRPRHEQVAAWLRRQIDACALAPNDRLPTEHELCERFGVSRITVRHALQTLATEGRIVRRQGSGSFVRPPRVPVGLARLTSFEEDAARAGLAGTSRVLAYGPEAACPDVAEALDLDPGTFVVRLDRLRLADGVPVAYDRTWLRLEVAARLDGHDLATETLFDVLAQAGVTVGSGRLRFDAAAAEAELAAALEIPLGTPVLRTRRTICTAGERPLFVQCRQYRADRAAFDLVLARDPEAAAPPSPDALPMRDLHGVLLPAAQAGQA